MDALYTAVATARGGREGEVVSDDGVLDLSLGVPEELGGGEGEHTNPEQLFAAGYAACFHAAVKSLAREQGLDIEPSEITARVSLGKEGDAFALAVTLVGALPTLDPPVGEKLMQDAHQRCPYSRATRGNIAVTLDLAPAPGA